MSLTITASLASRTLAALAPLVDLVRGRRVVVVCPSPGVVVPSMAPGDVVYAVNGGLGCVPIDRSIDVWQVNGRADRSSLRIEPTPLRVAWLDHGRHRSITGLVVFMRDIEGFGTRKELEARKLSYDWSFDVEKKFRAPLLEAIGVRPDPRMNPSSGLMALTMLSLCEPSAIVACGFAWQTGYEYLPDHPLTTTPAPRKHSESDEIVLSALLSYAPDLLRTTSPDFLTFGVRGL